MSIAVTVPTSANTAADASHASANLWTRSARYVLNFY